MWVGGFLFILCCVATVITSPRSEVSMLYYPVEQEIVEGTESTADVESEQSESIDVEPDFDGEEAMPEVLVGDGEDSQPVEKPKGKPATSTSADTSSSIRAAAKAFDPVKKAQSLYDDILKDVEKL